MLDLSLVIILVLTADVIIEEYICIIINLHLMPVVLWLNIFYIIVLVHVTLLKIFDIYD